MCFGSVIVIACVIWGCQWVRHRVQCYCNNEAVVAIIRSRTSRHPHLMHLLWCLFFVEPCYDLEVTCLHVPGAANELADDLSRNRVSAFLLKVPGASFQPTQVPTPLLHLLLDKDLDWLSPHWITQFRGIARRA